MHDAGALMRLARDEYLNLLLIRHGQAGGNGERDGLIGEALSSTGEEQAKLLAERMASLPLDYIYCSDMARSFQTADAVRKYHRNTPFESIPEVREISSFQMPGMPPARKAEERAILHEQRERVARFVAMIREKHKPGQLVAVIAHNGVNAMILAGIAGLPIRRTIRLVSCHTGVSVVSVDWKPPMAILRMMGCVRHLPPDLVTYINVQSNGFV